MTRMTKQDANDLLRRATFGDVEHQLPAAASAIDELVAVAAPAPVDQTAIDDGAAAVQEHETAAALMAHVHEVQPAVGISVNAADDLEVKAPRVDVVRSHVLHLPEVLLQHILTIIAWEDVAAFVEAVPTASQPAALQRLTMLAGVVDLHDHWPRINLFKIPDKHLRLALTALPAFSSIKVDAVSVWQAVERLAVTRRELIDALGLGRQLELTWADYSGAAPHVALSDIVSAWSDRVTAVEVFMFDPPTDTTVRDALARCVNVQRAGFYCREDSTTINACVDAVMTPAHIHLESLKVCTRGAYNADCIVAWLQTPYAKALDLSCSTVHCNGCLAKAIATSPGLTSPGLTSLKIQGDDELLRALAKYDLHRLTRVQIEMTPCALDVLRRLDATKVTSLNVGGGHGQYADAFGDVLAGFSALERLTLADPLPSNFGAGTCHRLVAYHGLVHDETVMQQFAQWLGTARALKRLCLSNSLRVPLNALGSILPQLMQRGLEYCEFSAHAASPAIAELLANALMYRRRHARRLTIHLQTLSLDALEVLLSALATCRNVTLHVMWKANDIAAANALVALHRLRVVLKYYSGGGMFASPV
ncbi:hypothetical protein SPRG_12029 [Saprolegnia parasitica CBS 223.65]|uniref:Uncharacterized protein n=1 Tax=Saprolegnia parasitica (strain CBS 223.65) TaxID=695850 RepID=A0A067C7U8_SAPPC|nr:hypothetical protein SPRG_12029 [Saprolegnia parasitica CBS 223.65]KDO22892.1 hypothetical protein SPRG_12029 [Saprolegnia parasitica CBS 223.65]|eukprot:XP_012206447.1 hypothetical protein SPRG_12029 [Saprolegnia parasitica CBS 223.65]